MKYAFTLFFILISAYGFTECDLPVNIDGETLLCPGGSTVLTTGEFESYQWYARSWGSDTPEPIDNATGQSLEVGENLVLSYISVEVDYDTCKVFSDEVLIDQLLFLPPVVAHVGEYATIINGSTYICPEHDFSLELMPGYNTNIIWYLDGNPIPESNIPQWKITESGNYTVSGAPSICPDFLQFLGLQIPVIIYDKTEIDLQLVNDPDALVIFNPGSFELIEWFFEGDLIQSDSPDSLILGNSGTYSVQALDNNGCTVTAEYIYIPSGLDNRISNNNLEVYPNPVSSILNLKSSEEFKTYQIRDISGKMIKAGKFKGQIDVLELETGQYHLALFNGKIWEHVLFIKEYNQN